jgi:hypothetical protein
VYLAEDTCKKFAALPIGGTIIPLVGFVLFTPKGIIVNSNLKSMSAHHQLHHHVYMAATGSRKLSVRIYAWFWKVKLGKTAPYLLYNLVQS